MACDWLRVRACCVSKRLRIKIWMCRKRRQHEIGCPAAIGAKQALNVMEDRLNGSPVGPSARELATRRGAVDGEAALLVVPGC